MDETLILSPSMSMVGRAVILVVGLLAVGVGIAVTLRAHLGVGPADVFLGAVAARVGVAHGTAVILFHVVLVASAVALGARPGPGTVLVAGSIGPIVNAALDVLPTAGASWVRVVSALGGLVAIGLGAGAVVAARWGPGSAELWTAAMAHRLRVRPDQVRLVLEGSLALVGLALGGPVGWFTFVVAASIGVLVTAGARATERLMGSGRRTYLRTRFRLSRL